MALPASGTITLAQIQTEFGGSNPVSLNEYYRGGVNVPNTVNTATIPTSGAISVSNFYGTQKSYTQAQVASYMDANLLDTFRWCNGGDASYDTFTNGPYERFTGYSTWTASFSLSGASITGTTKFTVIVGITGSSASFGTTAVNGSGVTAVSSTDYSSGYEMVIRVINCTGDFRNVTSVDVGWNRSGGNSGSWAAAMVVPGHWAQSHIGIVGSYTLGANTLSFMTAGQGGDGPVGWITDTGGMRYKQCDSWWYNNGGAGAFVNAGGSARTGVMGNLVVDLVALTSMSSTN
jgi:hypothetical protein